MTNKLHQITLSLFVSCFLLISNLPNAKSQTSVSGIISTNTQWCTNGSPYIVTGSILVDSGAILNICSGVTVKFSTGTSMQISGTLTANNVIFTSNATTPAKGDWGYILFNPKSKSYDTSTHLGSILKFCTIEYGGNSTVNAALQANGCFPYISNCEVRFNANCGIGLAHGSNFAQNQVRTQPAFILNCNIHDNSNTVTNYVGQNAWGGGIYLSFSSSNANVVIDNCTINNNRADLPNIPAQTGGGGIALVGSFSSGNIQITNCSIHDNVSTGNGGGIYGQNVPNVTIQNNLIYNDSSNSGGGGIYFNGTNWWGGTHGTADHNYICFNTAGTMGGGINESGMTTSNNVIAGNKANTYGGIFQSTFGDPLTNNHLIDNVASNFNVSAANDIGIYNHNTITRNKTTGAAPTVTMTMAGSNNCTVNANCNSNNICNNQSTYEFYDTRQQGCNINFLNSYWGYNVANRIDTVIFDFFDNSNLSLVSYSPFLNSPDTIAPILPPNHVTYYDLGGGNIHLAWHANTDADLAGYKIYYTTANGITYNSVINVGNVTNYTLTGVPANTTKIAITAYDNLATGTNDQLNGHESWYSTAVTIPYATLLSSKISICKGDTIQYYGAASNADTWSWSFPGGNPSSSSDQNPIVIYNNVGSHNAQLITANIAGNDTVSYANFITVHQMPTVNFSTVPSLCVNSNTITLNATPSSGVFSGSGVSSNTFNPQTSGSGTFTLQYIYTDSFGCGIDTVSQNVVVKPTYSQTISSTICAGDTFHFPDGYIATYPTTHVIHYTSILQCDSSITYQINFHNPAQSITNAGTCMTVGYLFNGTYYFNPGTYTVHFTGYLGCDSAAILHLSNIPNTSSTTNANICTGSSYTFNGNSYVNPGTYTVHLTNYLGCDSAAILNLNVLASSNSVTNGMVCSGDSINFNGQYFHTAGNHIVHLTNYLGCDSAALLHLVVSAPTTSTVFDTICKGSSFIFHSQSYTTAGNYAVHIANYLGCDSLITLHLKVDSINLSLLAIGGGLSVSTLNANSYVWIDCDNNQIVTGANQPTVGGQHLTDGHHYKCAMTSGNCNDTTACILFLNSGVNDLTTINTIQLMPNPTNGALTILVANNLSAIITLHDLAGKTLLTDKMDNVKLKTIDLSEIATGLYFIQIQTNDGNLATLKVVKQ